MTLEEALRFIDPKTDMDALAEVEYYNGFKGKEATATMYTVLESSGITPQFESPNAPTQFGFHSCKDGSYGMGDFLGMRKTEKDDENEVPH